MFFSQVVYTYLPHAKVNGKIKWLFVSLSFYMQIITLVKLCFENI